MDYFLLECAGDEKSSASLRHGPTFVWNSNQDTTSCLQYCLENHKIIESVRRNVPPERRSLSVSMKLLGENIQR